MKSVLSNKCCEKKEKPFPKLMIGDLTGSVVLFSKEKVGTVVYNSGNGGFKVGTYLEDWGSGFTDYEGDVCLTND
jgi:hypothetical protein